MTKRTTTARRPTAHEVPPVIPGDNMVVEEFASVAIRLDHLQNIDGKTVVALIMSTGTAPEEVLSLMAYHGRRVGVGESVQVARAVEVAAAFLLPINDRMSYIVVDRAAWDEVKADLERGNNSDMLTVAVFVAISHELKRQAKALGLPPMAVQSWLSE